MSDRQWRCESIGTHGLLAEVVNGNGGTDGVDGDLLARDTDHADNVVESEESSGLLGLVTVVLRGREE